MGVRHCTPNYGYRTDLITEILSSPYPLRFRSICFESIPCPLRLRTKLLKSTRIHCVYATLFSVFSLPTRTKKADFSLYPYSVANGNQDLKRCLFEAYFCFLWGRFFEIYSVGVRFDTCLVFLNRFLHFI